MWTPFKNRAEIERLSELVENTTSEINALKAENEELKDKVNKASLTREEIVPSTTSVLQPVFTDTIAYNLTPNRLYMIVQGLKTGDLRDYLTMAEELEEKDLHYRSVIGTRKSQVVSLESQILPSDDSEKAQEIAESIRRDIIQAPWFEDMKMDLLDALGKGFSVCEIIWGVKNGRWVPVDVKHKDPRFFEYDRETMSHIVLTKGGEQFELTKNKFIIHEPKLKSGFNLQNGLALPCAYYLLIKSYDVAGWAAFAQVYGYPLRIGRYGRGASENDKKVLRQAIASLGKDAGAIIPDSMNIEIVNGMTGSSGNIDLYEHLADWVDKQVSKGVLGQTMSTDAEGGQYKGDLHNEIRLEIKRADARQLAATIFRDLILPYIRFNFGEMEEYPEFRIVVPEPEDIPAIVNAVTSLVPLGFKVKADDLYGKLGLTKPEDTDDVLTPAAPAMPFMSGINTELNSQEDDDRDEVDELGDEELSDWQPVMQPFYDELAKIAGECDSFDAFMARMGELERRFEQKPDIIEALAKALFKARALGASDVMNEDE